MDSNTIYYCLSYPLLLTRHCGNVCGYCSYPLTQRSPLPSRKTLQREIQKALSLDAVQIELIAGENLERVPEIQKNLRYYNYNSFDEYLMELLTQLQQSTQHRPLLSLLNVGNLDQQQLNFLRPRICAVQILIESMDRHVSAGIAHGEAPCKEPEERLHSILNCARLSIPIASGMMLGIGEDDSSHLKTMEILSTVHHRYQNIQSFEIQTFWPRPGTPMAEMPEVTPEEIFSCVEMAREILPRGISLIVKGQEHPNLIEELIRCGVTDLGSISVRCQDQDEPRYWRNVLHLAQAACDKLGLELKPRLPLHKQFCNDHYYSNDHSPRIETALQRLKKLTA